MESSVLTVVVYPSIALFISGLIGWFFGRKKSKAQTDGIVIKNAEHVLKIQKKINDNMEEELKRMKNIVEQMRRQNNNYEIKCIQPEICKVSE